MVLLRRVLAALTQLALVLPFVVIEDCQSHARSSQTGLQAVAENPGWFVLPLLVAGLLLWRPIGADRPVGESLRAFGTAVAAFSTVGALFSRLFDNPQPQAGFFVILGAWVVLWTSCVARGFRPPFGWAYAAIAATPGVIGIAVQLHDGATGDALGVLVTTLILVVPLLPLFGALEGRSRPIAWIGLAALSFTSGILALPEGLPFTGIGIAAAIYAVWRALNQ